MKRRNHMEKFPLNDHMMSLIFIVSSDLKLDQREKLIQNYEVEISNLRDSNEQLAKTLEENKVNTAYSYE